MKTILFAVLTVAFSLIAAYNVGDTVSMSDNISWTDNYGYSSNIFNEVEQGKPVMIFFGQTW
ncbi:MAG: hypothetical protein PF638_03865 [Candidatus Delongbacteria bacterium]|jgi:hypothetical protein|nr:hypothetical protein [Candidatus Delongbacteria bacterium]